jgi:predicted permease
VFELLANSVAPAFLLILVGILVAPLALPGIVSINRLALYAASPALVLVSLTEAELSLTGAATLLSGHGLYMLISFALASLLARRLLPPERRAVVATGMFVNSANLMLPIALFALGDEGFVRAVVLYVFVTIALYTLAPLVLAGREGFRERSPLDLLKLPVIWAALLGLALNLLGVVPPLGLWRGVTLLSDAAIPLVLLLLGLQVRRSGWRRPRPASLGAAAFKLLLGPLIGFGAGWLVGARGLDLTVLTLLSAMPPAVNNLLLAIEFGGDADRVAETLVLATALSLLTITVVLRLLV